MIERDRRLGETAPASPAPPSKQTLPHPRTIALPAALPGLPQPPSSPALADLDLESAALALAFVTLAGLIATLRHAMARAVEERVLTRTEDAGVRERLSALFKKFDGLIHALDVLAIAAELVVVLLVARALTGSGPLDGLVILAAVTVALPVHWFVNDALARALAQRFGDAILVDCLPVIEVLQAPLFALGWLFAKVHLALHRAMGIRDEAKVTREIVADLREVLADVEVSGTLEENEREIIGNVMELRDEDVAAIMTPRTEIVAADVEDDVRSAARVLAESGHSRIPVYQDTLDTILGTITARDIVLLMAGDRVDSANLRTILHPAYFVPETKHLDELMAEMRARRLKVAVVLDEYGGTAGLVTMGDILGRLVGEIPDEYDQDEPSPMRTLADGSIEFEASLHVSEVNEALDLDLPEEADFETLGGFVLAELGHFPATGESFHSVGHEFSVTEANDRRVLRVRVRRTAEAKAS